MKRVEIDGLNLDVDYRDIGQWRCYELFTSGNTLNECVDNATIYEIDQDGGEITNYDLGNAEDEVYEASLEEIKKALVKNKTEAAMARFDEVIDKIRKGDMA